MEAPQALYGQSATHLVLRLFLRVDNMGDVSDRRWQAAVKKIRAGHSVLRVPPDVGHRFGLATAVF